MILIKYIIYLPDIFNEAIFISTILFKITWTKNYEIKS